MDETTVEGVLAYMAYRIVESRRRDLRETIALRLFKQNGTVSADEVDAGFAEEWVESDAQEVADLVARKAGASVAWHHEQAAVAAAGAERQVAKADRLSEQAAATLAAADQQLAEVDAILAEAEQAQAIFEAAEAAGGSAARAPSPNDAEARAQVAEAVGAANGPGGN